MASKIVDVDALSTDERLDLLERLWDSLSGSPGAISLTDAQLAELDRRDAELDEDIRMGRPLGIPWDEVLKEIRTRGRSLLSSVRWRRRTSRRPIGGTRSSDLAWATSF